MTDARWSYEPPSEAIWRKLRACDITSTESSALFGMSPYTTRFQLWHQKRNRVEVELKENERITWGSRLQDAIARGIADDNGVEVDKKPDYCRLVKSRMGASFDFEVVGGSGIRDSEMQDAFCAYGNGIFEIKCVDFLVFRDQWQRDDGTLEAPDHIEVQLQHQLHVSGYKWGAIGVLVSGHTPYVLIREYDAEAGNAIEAKVREFWKSIRENREPAPDLPADAEFVCKLRGYAEPNSVYDGRNDEDLQLAVSAYAKAAADESDAKARKLTARAIIYTRMGAAERAMADGYNVWAGLVGPAEIPAYTRDGYRSIKVTKRKEKR